MAKANGILWVALGGGVLASFYFLTRKSDDSAGADGPQPEPPPGPAGAGAKPAAAAKPAAPPQPALADMDERTALGRVIRSEAGSQTPAEQLAVAWVVKNRARARKTTIARMVCYPTCGPQGKARPFSSAQAARQSDLALADVVLKSGPADDPTKGAWDAFEPELQDKLVKAGRPGYTKTAAQVREDWLKTSDYLGKVGRWELFGPKAGAKPATPPPAQVAPKAEAAPASKPAATPVASATPGTPAIPAAQATTAAQAAAAPPAKQA